MTPSTPNPNRKHPLALVERLSASGVPIDSLADLAHVPPAVLSERIEAFRLTRKVVAHGWNRRDRSDGGDMTGRSVA